MKKMSGIMSPLTVGFVFGTAIGLAAIGMTGERNRKKIKRSAERTARTLGSFARDLTDIVKE